MNELLVIIDPQADFIDDAGLYAMKHTGIMQLKEAVNNIERLLKNIAPQNTVIVFSNYEANQFEKGLSICIPGTDGHKIGISNTTAAPLIAKTKHSCFTSAAFTLFLQENNIQKLLLAGFLAEYCVKQTALDALANGFAVTLLQDCIGTGDDVQPRKEQMLLELQALGAEISDSNE